jgi:hypothetical protein
LMLRCRANAACLPCSCLSQSCSSMSAIISHWISSVNSHLRILIISHWMCN